jgi:GTP pyrophosphokinase
MQVVLAKYGFKEWEGILATVGHGGLKEGQVINRLAEEYAKDHKEELTDEQILEKVRETAKKKAHITKSKSGIVVKGIDDMAVRFSRCCNPVPGDEIVGFVTRGRGLSIHRTDCVNMLNLTDSERSRLIDAEWEASLTEDKGQYMSSVKVFANNRQGMLMEISKVFTENKIDINSINTHTSKQEVATLDISFVVSGRDQLNHIVEKLRQIPGVIDIERTTG